MSKFYKVLNPVLLFTGLAATALVHYETLVWILTTWKISPIMDGHGPLVLCLAVIAWVILGDRAKKEGLALSWAGVIILGVSLVALFLAADIHINIVRGLSLVGCILGTAVFVSGAGALSQLFPIWILLVCALPTISYIFDLTVNPVLSNGTQIISRTASNLPALGALNSDITHFYLDKVNHGAFMGSPTLIFAMGVFISALIWKTLKKSWLILLIVILEIPLIRFLTAALLTFKVEADTFSLVAIYNSVFFVSLFIYGITLGGILCLRLLKTR